MHGIIRAFMACLRHRQRASAKSLPREGGRHLAATAFSVCPARFSSKPAPPFFRTVSWCLASLSSGIRLPTGLSVARFSPQIGSVQVE